MFILLFFVAVVVVTVQNTTRNREATQGSAYEDVDVNNAEPVIHPKPEPASSGATMSSKTAEYDVVSKAKPGATAAPTNGPENSVYASVDKCKKASARAVQTATGESSKESSDHPPLPGAGIKPEVKPKPTKPEKPKKNKGKAKERGKKGNYILIQVRHTTKLHFWGFCLRCTVLGDKTKFVVCLCSSPSRLHCGSPLLRCFPYPCHSSPYERSRVIIQL